MLSDALIWGMREKSMSGMSLKQVIAAEVTLPVFCALLGAYMK